MTGSGTQLNPYIISTPSDLDAVRNNMTAYYELGNDIDMSGFGSFTPIGLNIENNTRFNGHFDGKGFKIKNLTINESSNYTGLFGITNNNSIIKNIGIENCNVSGTGDYSGALIGRSYGQVNNCYSTGTVTGGSQVGGLIGYNYVGIIQNCYSKCTVSGINYLGGFIGHPGPNYSTPVLRNCFSIGSVDITTNSGGFAGFYDNTTVENCFFDSQTSGHITDPVATQKTTAQMKSQLTFTNWDFNDIWAIDNDYPYLQMFGSSSSGVEEERQVTSYLNNICSSLDTSKRIQKEVNSLTKTIITDINTYRSKSTNLNSYVGKIYSDILLQNKINKIINIESHIKQINSNIESQVAGYRQPISFVSPINSKAILPYLFVCANCLYEQNLSNSSIIENLSSVSSINNPSYMEVMV